MNIQQMFQDFPVFDVITKILDIGLIFYVVYRMMLLMRGTKGLQMLIGIILVLGLFFLSQEEYLNLATVNWVLDKFVGSFIIIVIILFAPDIRRALSEVGKNPLFLKGSKGRGSSIYEEVIRAVTRLSAKKIGALIVLERDADLSPYTESAIAIDAKISSDTLFSIFIPSYENPLHDGAVIIRKGRISHAGCFLPLTDSPKVEKTLGTRHRAAIGITEETDAVVVVVSEETGIISLAYDGKLERDLTPNDLREDLMKFFGQPRERHMEAENE